MSNNDEQYLDFLRYQEVSVENTIAKNDRTVSKSDHKFMAKAAAKEDRKRGR